MFDSVRRYVNSSEYLRTAKDALLRRTPAGHNLTVLPDDIFFVSYMRSGQTWSRFLIANLRNPDTPASFADITERVPAIHSHSDEFLLKLPRPRVIASHKFFYPYYPAVVYIVRDPRDVAVSRYYYELKLGNISDSHPMDEFIRDFVSGHVDEYRKTGGWADHVLSWLSMRAGRRDFLLLRYEDLRRDTTAELRRLASFMKLTEDEARLRRAIDLSSPERMRQMDHEKPLGFLRGTRQDVPFVRRGVAGGWKSQLSKRALQTIESAWWPLLQLLGYELTTNPNSMAAPPQVNAATCSVLLSVPFFNRVPLADVEESANDAVSG